MNYREYNQSILAHFLSLSLLDHDADDCGGDADDDRSCKKFKREEKKCFKKIIIITYFALC